MSTSSESYSSVLIEVWSEVESRISNNKTDLEADLNPSWKTVRIFVSSTFRDFNSEREILVKEVFPDLREWCESRKLYLVECDLRWGVPEKLPKEESIRACLDEIERCRQENIHPYFLNMLSQRIGWIPIKEELAEDVIVEFDIILGLSVTEMEIVKGAYCVKNPNALFMLRKDEFLQNIDDEEVKRMYVDDQLIANEKLTILKNKIISRFQHPQLLEYSCSYIQTTEEKGKKTPRLALDPVFKSNVIEFFKNRINIQYPICDEIQQDKYAKSIYEHKCFMEKMANSVYGREEFVKEQILSYIMNDKTRKPFVISGVAGSGKTAIMALAVQKTKEELRKNKEIENKTILFYHFTGAVPYSTSLFFLLKRLLKVLSPNEEADRMDEVINCISSFLSQTRSSIKIILFIDAINQLDEKDAERVFSWVPPILSSNIKIIFSLIQGSGAEVKVQKRFDLDLVEVPMLKLFSQKEIIEKYLFNFRKVLNTDQFLHILSKSGANNPLFLVVACEELRVFGSFRDINSKIESLPENLNELLKQVINRLKDESYEDGELLKSALCLLEVSNSGLLEVELLEMLATLDTETDYSSLTPQHVSQRPHLLAYKWSVVYRSLRPFVRPFGSPGEGRLNFYHQTLKQVIRECYLSKKNEGKNKYIEDKEERKKWHIMLADQFELSPNYDRKIEEYPHHLMILNDKKRMKKFLLDWKTFDLLYNSEHSPELLKYWDFAEDGNFKAVPTNYCRMLDVSKSKNMNTKDLIAKYEQVARFCGQCGQYNESLRIAKECLRMNESESESESRKLNRMYLIGHMAHLQTQILKGNDYSEIIALHEYAITIGKEFWIYDLSAKKYVALQLIKKAYCMGQMAKSMSGLFSGRKKSAKFADALELTNQATVLYTELKFPVLKLEADLTKATLLQDNKEKHKVHNEILKQVSDMFGPLHHLSMRVHFNEGIAYEGEKNYIEAYQSFKRAYHSSRALNGETHPKTNYYKKTLEEERYVKMGRELGDEV